MAVLNEFSVVSEQVHYLKDHLKKARETSQTWKQNFNGTFLVKLVLSQILYINTFSVTSYKHIRMGAQ